MLDKGDLTWPWNGVAPWSFHSCTDVAYSQGFAARMGALLQQPAPGLGGLSYTAAIAKFQALGCGMLVFGGSVRDTILAQSVRDVDVEFTCPPIVFEQICHLEYGALCKYEADNFHFQLNPEVLFPLEGTSWKTILPMPLYALEFTVNSLTYDVTGSGNVIDVTGLGVSDVCARLIRLTANRDEWDLWVETGSAGSTTGMRKLPRYWKMVYRGFTPATQDIAPFMVNKTKPLCIVTGKQIGRASCRERV